MKFKKYISEAHLAKNPHQVILSDDQWWIAAKPEKFIGTNGRFKNNDKDIVQGAQDYSEVFKMAMKRFGQGFSIYIAKQHQGNNHITFEYTWDQIKPRK